MTHPRRAFTLIELSVVFVMAMLLIPRFRQEGGPRTPSSDPVPAGPPSQEH